jgi:hypothetical protein
VSNALTGDFDAVLEIGGRTLDRLAASMHQNGSVDPERPTLPHVAAFRLGAGGGGVNDPRGTVFAQIGVPQVVLIDGSTDRFGIEFGLRARYRPDPGSAPLADVIHGTVQAQFTLQTIDPRCPGWKGLAEQYLWPRLVDGSVSFEGVALDDVGDPAVLDEAAAKAVITQQLALLFETAFEANPQQVGDRFQHGFRCLVPAAATQAAVAFPISLSGGSPAGDVSSMDRLFLGESDFGIAVSSEPIIAQIQAQLQGLAGTQKSFQVRRDSGAWGSFTIDYSIRLDAIGAQWLGALVPALVPTDLHGLVAPGEGAIRIDFDGSGWTTGWYQGGIYNFGSINASDLNATFAGSQLLALTFDPASGSFQVSALGNPTVSVNYGGPEAGDVVAIAQQNIAQQMHANLQGALQQAASQLNAITSSGQTGTLVDQLRRIDPGASIRFDRADFLPQGVSVLGTIGLAPRRAPVVAFERTDAGDGFSAVQSWIPGGRIDTFDWTWRWVVPNPVQPPPGPPGSEEDTHDFLLRRTQRGITKFQMSLFGDKPLPGIDGNGSICLTLRGVQVDSTTGVLVPVQTVSTCEQFVFDFHIPLALSPSMSLYDASGKRRDGRFQEIARTLVSARASTTNMLALYMGARWEPELVSVLASGLNGCRRYGTGLLVVTIVDEGALSAGGKRLATTLKTAAAQLEAPMLAVEDTDKEWSLALGVPPKGAQPAWRLLSPAGTLTWAADGPVEVTQISSVLDKCLVIGPGARPSPIRPAARQNERVPISLGEPGCPPVPLVRPGSAGSRLIFIRKEQSTVLAPLRRSGASSLASGDLLVAAIVAGATSREVKRLQSELSLDFPVVADVSGALARQAGVRLWPTTLTLDHLGRLAGSEMGVAEEGGGR